MTPEEALGRYDRIRYNLLNHDDKVAADIAFDALREKVARSKGCPYCTCTFVVQGKLTKFCPACGRRLEEV